jgi:hypothetical protein
MINWDQNRSRFRDKMTKYDEKLRLLSITADIIEFTRCLKVILGGFGSHLKCFRINQTFVMVWCVG